MRQRAADDVETINARLQELRKERERVRAICDGCIAAACRENGCQDDRSAYGLHSPGQVIELPCDTEQDTQDHACGFVVTWPYPAEPGEHTDGAKPQTTRTISAAEDWMQRAYVEWLAPYCLHPQVMGFKPGGCALYPGCGCGRTPGEHTDGA
jgi:hypothetical protein